MIFVPSINGVSHSPEEHTPPQDLEAGANVLLALISQLASDGTSAMSTEFDLKQQRGGLGLDRISNPSR
jgi:hypothetical protein